MKIMIASDVHGSFAAVKDILRRMEAEKAEQLILLGDVYNHGPRNPFPEEYAPMKVAEALNGMVDRLTVIRGNCDSEVDEMISSFRFVESAMLFVGKKKVFLTHGHKYNEDNIPPCDALIYGHFHIPFIKEKDGVIVANPGSAALPKNGTPKGYLLIEGSLLTLKDLDGNVLDEKEL